MEDDDLSYFLDNQSKIEIESCMNVAYVDDDVSKFVDGKLLNIIYCLFSRY